ncbi:MAG: phage head morphogenesis protein [Desulfobulbus sp.]|nr:phage head morphogenesis protein [Desulfobulbus sp.]
MPRSPTLAGVINLPFAEQIDFFRQKLNLPTERWDDIERAAHDRAFIVAGAMKADLLNDLREAVEKGIATGTTLKTFREDFAAIVAKHGWTGWTGEGTAAGRAWRTRVIHETNLRTSYAAGRWQQLHDPELQKRAPYWRYIHDDSVLSPRPQHKAWGDTRLTLRFDHPFWQTHFPPNGWGCRCRIVAVHAPGPDDATEPPAGWNTRGENGQLPGIDRGWDYAPGANVSTPLQDLVDRKLFNLDAPIGSALYQSLAPALLTEKTAAFGAFVDTALASMQSRGKNMVVGALAPQWVRAAQQRGIAPVTAEIMVRDQDVIHTFRNAKSDQLPLDWYKQLPMHLQSPQAVVLDTTHPRPAFLLVYDVGQQAKKLVVQIDYQVRKAGTFNVLDTGRVMNSVDIKGQLGSGYELVEGQL